MIMIIMNNKWDNRDKMTNKMNNKWDNRDNNSVNNNR